MDYKVKEGDTLESVAKEYDLTVVELVVANVQRLSSSSLQAGSVIDVPAVYVAREGDSYPSIAARFDTSTEDLLAINPPISEEDAASAPKVGRRLLIPRREPVQALIEEIAHSEYLASRADLDGVNEDDLGRLCIQDRRPSVSRAFERLQDVKDQRYAPRNRWDDAARVLVISLLVILALGVLLTVVALVQWLLSSVIDGYHGWSWVGPGFFGLAVAFMAVLAFGVQVENASTRADARFLRESTWAARRRDFDSVVRSLVVHPAIRDLTKVRFTRPSDDPIHIDSASITTTASREQIIRTDTYRQIARHLARSDGATLGLRGCRGAGKTDLVRAFCGVDSGNGTTGDGGVSPDAPRGSQRPVDDAQRTVGVFISAPTSIDEFAFLRRVALLVCDSTLRLDGVKPTTPAGRATRAMAPLLGIATGVALVAVGVGLLAGVPQQLADIDAGWLLVALGAAVTVSALSWQWRRFSRVHSDKKARRPWRSTKGHDASLALLNRAAVRAHGLQERLRFSREVSESREGGFSWKALTATVGRSVKVADYPLTKEDIVEELQVLIGLLDDAGYRVTIGVDELDRLEVEDQTAELLNAMKSLFAIPGCSFIVTISTSAWASFEQRGLHVRTVFDSSFDEIVEAAPLSFLEARSMLRGRGAVLSDTQVMLVNIAAGGVARDVIRNARALGDLSDLASTPPSTWGAVQGFVMLEARSKVEAAILDIRGMEAGETGESTVALLDEIRAGFDNLDFDDLMAELERHCSSSDRLLVRHSDASTRETNGDRPDPAPPGDSAPRLRVLSRTVAYLGFLRLLELAFSDDGAVAALASPEPVLYGEFSRAQLRPLEELLETKEWLGTGCATAIVRLREAHERLLSARSAPVAPESGAP